jgi:hypothetical protein
MGLRKLARDHAHKAVAALTLVVAIKSAAGLSMAAVAAFNVVADKGFAYSPTLTMDGLVAFAGAMLGFVISARG